jgi:hypothetical protein
MVKMQIAGITIEVPMSDVGFYKQAGYSVVVGKPAAPVVPPVDPTPEPVAPVVDPVKSKKDK